jgi:hypothetical protein
MLDEYPFSRRPGSVDICEQVHEIRDEERGKGAESQRAGSIADAKDQPGLPPAEGRHWR